MQMCTGCVNESVNSMEHTELTETCDNVHRSGHIMHGVEFGSSWIESEQRTGTKRMKK